MINLEWCAALWIAGDSYSLPNPLPKRGRKGRVWGEASNGMYGNAQCMTAKLKSVAKSSAGVCRPNSTENSPWHGRGNAVRIKHVWLSHPAGCSFHHCLVLSVLHKEIFSLEQGNMLILHELFTHTLRPILLYCVKGALWQEIQAYCLAITPINSFRLILITSVGFGLQLLSKKKMKLQYVKQLCDSVSCISISELADSFTIGTVFTIYHINVYWAPLDFEK